MWLNLKDPAGKVGHTVSCSHTPRVSSLWVCVCVGGCVSVYCMCVWREGEAPRQTEEVLFPVCFVQLGHTYCLCLLLLFIDINENHLSAPSQFTVV